MSKVTGVRLPDDIESFFISELIKSPDFNKSEFIIKATREAISKQDSDTRRCYKCDSTLSKVCFNKDSSKKGGLSNLCKNCTAIKNNK